MATAEIAATAAMREMMKKAGWGSDNSMCQGEQYGGSPAYRPSKVDLALDEACFSAGAYAPFEDDAGGYAAQTVITEIRETIKFATGDLRRTYNNKATVFAAGRADATVTGLADLGFADATQIEKLCKTVRDYHEAERAFNSRNNAFKDAFAQVVGTSPYVVARRRFYKEAEDAESVKKAATMAAATAAKAQREAAKAAAFDARVAAAVAASLAERNGPAAKRPRE